MAPILIPASSKVLERIEIEFVKLFYRVQDHQNSRGTCLQLDSPKIIPPKPQFTWSDKTVTNSHFCHKSVTIHTETSTQYCKIYDSTPSPEMERISRNIDKSKCCDGMWKWKVSSKMESFGQMAKCRVRVTELHRLSVREHSSTCSYRSLDSPCKSANLTDHSLPDRIALEIWPSAHFLPGTEASTGPRWQLT